MMTDDGSKLVGTWQVVDVNRPLCSVRQICKQGNRVIFGEHGGVIQNITTGHEIPFWVEGDIYVLDMWLGPENFEEHGAPPGGLGFPRPGNQ